jgi:hypothetical protein
MLVMVWVEPMTIVWVEPMLVLPAHVVSSPVSHLT